MEYKDVATWSQAVDESLVSAIVSNLPEDAAPGTLMEEALTDGRHRLWQRVVLISGAVGGRWAYWKSWKTPAGQWGVGAHPEWLSIADILFNGDAHHFIGMLPTPYVPLPQAPPLQAWVLVSPKLEAPRPVFVPEEKRERYEKSKEVFNLNDQTSTFLP